jgi:hypothetical protein
MALPLDMLRTDHTDRRTARSVPGRTIDLAGVV